MDGDGCVQRAQDGESVIDVVWSQADLWQLFVLSVSGLNHGQREVVSEYLMTVDTGIRQCLRLNGLSNVDVSLSQVFNSMCVGIGNIKAERMVPGETADMIPWVVCMGFMPVDDDSSLRSVTFWDTSCPPGVTRPSM